MRRALQSAGFIVAGFGLLLCGLVVANLWISIACLGLALFLVHSTSES